MPIKQESWPAAHCRQQTRVPAFTPFGQALFLPPVLSLVNIDLDVYGLSTGSGYLSAVMGHLVGDTGHVLGIERVPQLAQRSIPSLRRAAPQLCVSHPQHCTQPFWPSCFAVQPARMGTASCVLNNMAFEAVEFCGNVWGRYEKGTVTLKAGNALDDPALDKYGPFSAIHVGAAASDLPQVLRL